MYNAERALHLLPAGADVQRLDPCLACLNDVARARALLQSTHRRRVFVASRDAAAPVRHGRRGDEDATRDAGCGSAALQAPSPNPQPSVPDGFDAVVVQNLWPGSVSWSVFVRAGRPLASAAATQPPCNPAPRAHDDAHSNLPHQLQQQQRDQRRFQQHLYQEVARALPGLPDAANALNFAALPEPGVAAMRNVLPGLGYSETYQEPCLRYTLRGPLPPGVASSCREQAEQLQAQGYEVGPLQEGDIELVNELWAYRSATSLDLIRLILKARHTACIRPPGYSGPCSPTPVGDGAFTAACSAPHMPKAEPASSSNSNVQQRAQHQPAAAWIVQYADGSIGMAHTLAAHRRKGLMRVCIAELVRSIQADCGRHQEIFGFVVQNNEASQQLFEGMGFARDPMLYYWIGFERHR